MKMNETKYVLALFLVLSVGYTSGGVLSSSSILDQQGQENVTQYDVVQEQVLQKCDKEEEASKECDEEGASKACDCSFCYCFNGHWSCSNKLCATNSEPLETDNDSQETSTKAYEDPDNQEDPDYNDPGYQEDPDYKECVEGTRWREECNICECAFGQALCTMNNCQKECVEGSSWVDDCNTCECPYGEVSCTDKICLSDSAPICAEGSSWTEDCNTCFCVNDIASCTKKVCPTEGDDTITQPPEMTFTKENNTSDMAGNIGIMRGAKMSQGLSSNSITIPSELNFCKYEIDGQLKTHAYLEKCYKAGKLACAYCKGSHLYNARTCKCHPKARFGKKKV